MMLRSRLPADADAEQLRNAVEEGASLSPASNCILDPPKSVKPPSNIAVMHDVAEPSGLHRKEPACCALQELDFLYKLFDAAIC